MYFGLSVKGDRCKGAEDHKSENAGDAEIKGKMHSCRLQKQQSKTGRVVAEAPPPPREYMKPKKADGADQMIEKAEVVDSPEYVNSEPAYEAFAEERGNTTEEASRFRPYGGEGGSSCREPVPAVPAQVSKESPAKDESPR